MGVAVTSYGTTGPAINIGAYAKGAPSPAIKHGVISRDWRIVIPEWHQTFIESDFGLGALPSYSYASGEHYPGDDDNLFRVHTMLKFVGEDFPGELLGIRALASDFLYSNVYQGPNPDDISLVRSGNNTVYQGIAFWLALDTDSNAYHSGGGLATKLKNRMMTQAGMAGVAYDYYFTNTADETEMLGATGYNMIRAYESGNSILSAEVDLAFRQMLISLFERIEVKSLPRSINENIDMQSLPFFYRMKALFGTEKNISERALALAKRWYGGRSPDALVRVQDAGQACFRTYGGVGETNGAATSYLGLALDYMTMTALMAEFDSASSWTSWMAPALNQVYLWMSAQTWTDPTNGTQIYHNGPTGFSARLARECVRQQGGGFNNALCAAIVINAESISPNYATSWCNNLDFADESRHPGIRSAAQMNSDLSTGEVANRVNNASVGMGYDDEVLTTLLDPFDGDVSNNQYWAKIPHWHMYQYIPDGAYAWIWNLEDTVDDELKLMLNQRAGHYNIRFENNNDVMDTPGYEFWAVKNEDTQGSPKDFGFFIETINEEPNGYSDRWSNGGSIQRFSSEEVGTVILSKSGGSGGPKHDIENFALENWAVHHLWGYEAGGDGFTTAKVETAAGSIERDYGEYNATIPKVVVTGSLISAVTGYAALASTTTAFTKTFTKIADGLQYDMLLTASGSPADNITELWETIPIFLQANNDGNGDGIDSTMDYIVGAGAWTTLTEATVDNVDHIRLGRTFNSVTKYAYIDFPTAVSLRRMPQRVMCLVNEEIVAEERTSMTVKTFQGRAMDNDAVDIDGDEDLVLTASHAAGATTLNFDDGAGGGVTISASVNDPVNCDFWATSDTTRDRLSGIQIKFYSGGAAEFPASTAYGFTCTTVDPS